MRRSTLVVLVAATVVLVGGLAARLVTGERSADEGAGAVLGTVSSSQADAARPPAPDDSAVAPAAGDPIVPPARFGERVLETSPPGRRYARDLVVVTLEDGVRPATVRRLAARVDAEIEARVPKLDVAVLEVESGSVRDAMAELEESAAVEHVERDVIVRSFASLEPLRPDDMLWESQWGLKLVEADRAWRTTTGVAGVTVAILDTGVDASHPDLAGAVAPGFDFVNGDDDASDDEGHGTSAAGVLAARGNNREGQAGVCWHCTILPVKVLDASGSGTASALAAGIVWAVDRGARVISMSLGAATTTQALTEALDYASGKGVILVAAAGNSGTTTPSYPAAHPHVMSVAATDAADALYEWSNRGTWVDVSAPGCNPAPMLGASYVSFCGTSSSAPVVAGIAALALAARPDAARDEIQRAMETSAVRIAGDVRFGRVSATSTFAALAVPPPAEAAAIVRATFRGRVAPRVVRRYVRSVGAGRVSATLTAPPKTPLALVVRDAAGRTIARVQRRGAIRFARTLPAGRYVFTVTGRGSYSLALAHPPAAG